MISESQPWGRFKGREMYSRTFREFQSVWLQCRCKGPEYQRTKTGCVAGARFI